MNTMQIKKILSLVIVFLISVPLCIAQEKNSILSICDNDDRIRTEDPRVGRFRRYDDQVFGTVWLASNGAILTAGHAVGMEVSWSIEFNIKSSLLWGGNVASEPEDIYVVDTSSIVSAYTGMGNDWKIFRCFPNSITGLLPHQAQNDFFRMTNEVPEASDVIRITGCGVDDDPPGYLSSHNSDNQTIQMDNGPYVGETNINDNMVYHEYIVDTRSNNSGSPIIWMPGELTIGIHTNGGCNPPTGNAGTSLANDGLEAALQNFHGPNTIYVDTFTSSINEDGTIFYPFDTVSEGINAAINGGQLFITTVGNKPEEKKLANDV